MPAMDAAKRNALRLMNDAEVPYVLLSGFYGDSGGDLDLLVPLEGIPFFSRFCTRHGVLQQRRPAQYSNHFFYFLNIHGYRPLRIHVKYECTFYDSRVGKFRVFSRSASVMDSRQRYEGWFIPGAWNLILLYAAKCAFVEKARLSPSHLLNLSDFILRNRGRLTDPDQAHFVEQLLGTLVADTPEATSDALAHLLLPVFPLGSGHVISRQLCLWDRIGFPAYSLLFVGCDGSGKSTLLQLLRTQLELPAERLYGGLGPAEWMFPWIEAFRRRMEVRGRVLRALGILLWMLMLFPLELGGRVARRVWLARRAVLLIDRFPEFAFVGKWARLTAPLYRMILPKPTMVVEVTAPIPVLLERRGDELDVETAATKSQEAHRLATYFVQRGAKSIEIDSSLLTAEASVSNVLLHLWTDSRFVARILKPATFPRYGKD